MAASSELKARCPSCGTTYWLAAHAVGRKARCAQCKSLFLVSDPAVESYFPAAGTTLSEPEAQAREQCVEPAFCRSESTGWKPVPHERLPHPPTEEDILRWLADAESDADRERRAEREADGVDAFDMPAPASPRIVREEASPSVPRLRLHVTDESGMETSTDVPMRRVV